MSHLTKAKPKTKFVNDTFVNQALEALKSLINGFSYEEIENKNRINLEIKGVTWYGRNTPYLTKEKGVWELYLDSYDNWDIANKLVKGFEKAYVSAAARRALKEMRWSQKTNNREDGIIHIRARR